MIDEFYIYITPLSDITNSKPQNSLEECVSMIIESQTSTNFKNDLKNALKNNRITGNKFKDKLLKFLSHSPDSLSSDIPTVMDIISFTLTVILPTAIHPVIGLFSYLATRIVREYVDAKVIGKYISIYNLQIQNVTKKMENEEDPDKKRFWKEMQKDLIKGRDTMMDKKEDLRDLDPTGNSKFLSTVELNEAFLLFENCIDNLSSLQKAELWDDIFEDTNDTLINESLSKDIKMKSKIVKKKISDKEKAMDKWFDDTLKSMRDNMRNQKRDMIVQNNFPKLSKLIKRAITVGAAFAINPAIAGISLMTMFVLSKHGTESEKRKLLMELNRELEIVNAKIQDADSNGDKKEKYELMRLKHKIQTNIDKIKGYI